MNSIYKVRGFLKTYNIKGADISIVAGVKPSTVRVVLSGCGSSPKVRNATVELLRFSDPAAADEVETLWPVGERLVA